MRKLILMAALCAAGPALADRDQATQLVVNNLVGMGGDPAQSTVIARCFTDRMTEAQAAAFVASRTETDRQQVLAAIEDKDGATACMQQAMGG